MMQTGGGGSGWLRETLRPQEVLWSRSFLAPPEDPGPLLDADACESCLQARFNWRLSRESFLSVTRWKMTGSEFSDYPVGVLLGAADFFLPERRTG